MSAQVCQYPAGGLHAGHCPENHEIQASACRLGSGEVSVGVSV